MTEERLDRIEHITAGLAEERKKDREENRQWWRETQRQLNDLPDRVSELSGRVSELSGHVSELALKLSAAEDAITRLAEESRAANKRLEDRIESLVLATGQFLSALPKPKGA